MMAADASRLNAEQCWSLLKRQEVGRLAYHEGTRVQIVPINYAVDGQRVVFRTTKGSKLTNLLVNPDVALEVDEVEGSTASSVVVRGKAREVGHKEALMADQLRLRPWVRDATTGHVVTIDVVELSGRSFELSRPWTSMLQDRAV
ncbi:MAG: pyridoxamine 5'-phosphate oxidase family protein [Dermatophilaceae bacterium]